MRISFYMGEEQWRQLADLVGREGRKTSELARQAITEFLKSYRPLPIPEKKERQ